MEGCVVPDPDVMGTRCRLRFRDIDDAESKLSSNHARIAFSAEEMAASCTPPFSTFAVKCLG